MARLLYERSVSHRGYLIIPYRFERINGQPIYSYKLLSELGHKDPLHKANNPANLHSSAIESILQIAQEHLDRHAQIPQPTHSFKGRYTYRNSLIVVYRQGRKCFYDHYPPHELTNIAAPKIFTTEGECLRWVKQGLDSDSSPVSDGRSAG